MCELDLATCSIADTEFTAEFALEAVAALEADLEDVRLEVADYAEELAVAKEDGVVKDAARVASEARLLASAEEAVAQAEAEAAAYHLALHARSGSMQHRAERE